VSLDAYRRKRDPARTPEPVPAAADPASDPATGPAGSAQAGPGQAGSAAGGVFVVQEHHARALHWDFRLERDGVLVSWAVPKGIPDDPGRNHLAVHTEDHPLAYASFEGEIPRGEYGGGTVTIWDRGRYELVKWTPGEVKVVLRGQRLSGGYTLFRTRDDDWMIHRERVALPAWVRPMFATGGGLPASDDGWAYEMKWDGVRASAYVAGGRLLRLLSRSGRDITAAYPELRGLGTAAGLAPGTTRGGRQMVLDGEIVAFAAGRPSFEALQQRMHVTVEAQAARLAAQVPVAYLVFDLLHLDGRDLLELPYAQRREVLEGLGLAGRYWQTPPTFTGVAGTGMLAVAAEQGLEGVVAKRVDAPYRPGSRSGEWRKVKPICRQEAVVGGISPGKGGRTGQIGSLLLGVAASGGLAYAGRVGTGFTEQALRMLWDRLVPLRTGSCPFTTEVPPAQARGAIWVEPRLVIEVEFTGWTQAGRMRAASYQGLRDDKDPAEVTREP
jgi:bifunctional non-homologous end joining protein LigD